MFKRKTLLIIMVAILVLGVSFNSLTGVAVNKANVKQSIQLNINGGNVKIKNGSSDVIEFAYYGSASKADFNLVTEIKSNIQNIDLTYIGTGKESTMKEGGLMIKLPKKKFKLLKIKGTEGSEISLYNIGIDTNLITKSCYVLMKSKKSTNKITINSKYDTYDIRIAPITKDFSLKADASFINFKFTKKPSNLLFKSFGDNSNFILPKNWNNNYSVGAEKPEMQIENNRGHFQLSIN